MPIIDLYFDPAELDGYIWAIVGVIGIAFIIQMFYYIYFYTGILSQEKKKRRAELPFLQSAHQSSKFVFLLRVLFFLRKGSSWQVRKS